MTDATECNKYCVNVCIKIQCQYHHAVNLVNKGFVIFGTIQHSNTF